VPVLTLSPDEVVLLRLSAQLLVGAGGPQAMAAESALAKLARDAGEASPPVTRAPLRWAFREASADESHVLSLAEAITRRQEVSFRYRTGETPADQTRRVQPWGLGYRNGGWYLSGFDTDQRDSRVFRVGRIAGDPRVSRREAAFEVPPGLALDRFFEAGPWSFGPVQGPSVEARLLIEEKAAQRLLAVLPTDIAARRLDDGRVVLRMLVRDATAFFDWLLSLGTEVSLLGPAELRAQLAVRLETTGVAWSTR
jgi:predicted DNA-binding transcriptional regulator YafY